MKVIEVTCDSYKDKENVGALFTKKEREIICTALDEHAAKHKKRITVKRLRDYWYKHMPV